MHMYFKGHLEVCRWLWSNGAVADVHRANDHGCTPFLVACEEGHLPICQWLVDEAG